MWAGQAVLALAGMAQSVDGVATGGFVFDAVITAVGPGHATVGGLAEPLSVRMTRTLSGQSLRNRSIKPRAVACLRP